MHSHFVYGMDDGAKTRSDMEGMLDAAYENRVEILYATPHVIPGMQPFDDRLFMRHIEEAREYCSGKRYPITIYPGAEILYTPALSSYALDNRLPTLGDSRQILVEFLPDVPFEELEAAVSMLTRVGYNVILAHAERYQCLYRRNNIWKIKEMCDIKLQINCGSVLRTKGFFRQRALDKWFREELADYVSSDAHDCEKRPMRMRDAYEALCGKYGADYAARLTGLERQCRH